MNINIDANETTKMLDDLKSHCQSRGQAAADNIRKSGQFLAAKLGDASIAQQSDQGARNAQRNAAMLAKALGF